MVQSSIISAHSVNAINPLITQSPPSKTQPQHPKHMQQALQARQKKVQVYTWTVEALQRQYQRRLCEDRLLAQKHEQEWARLHHHRQQLEHTISDYTQQIQAHETALQAARAHAQQRQSKYHTRQRQFHRYAKIPMLGGTYKQKYLRAQKKNQVAESDVAAQRHGIDHIKDNRTALVRQLQQQTGDEEWVTLLLDDLKTRMALYETQMAHWNQGPPDDDDDEWPALHDIDFECAKCMQFVRQDHPRPDKNRPTDILCTACYQGARTSMIIKKKLGFLHHNSPTSSSLSLTPSSSRQSSFVNPPSPPPKDNLPPYSKHVL
ncbi:hypothetical protein [Absidia glauca]|uniref:Uncharacterized protein n=1 Tax=Absidia glauca TaxID=4829 RepID=A0A163JUV0_ABSGL|nr:hypothetical protein [Absidia glauca]